MTDPPEPLFQIAVLTEDASRFDAFPLLPQIQWLPCRMADRFVLEFLSGETVGVSIDFRNAKHPLPDLIAIICVGDAEAMHALQESWAACFPAVPVEIVCVPSFDVQAITGCAIRCLAATLWRQRCFAGRAALDLAVYRREFERLQHCFSRLEEYVSRNSLQEPAILFEYAVAPPAIFKGAGLPDEAGGDAGDARRLRQYLPVDSLGVAGLALFIRTKLPAGTVLRAELRAAEIDRTFGVWSFDAVPVGWVHLALTTAIDEPAIGLTLLLDLPAGLPSMAVALGQPHPYPEFRAQVDGGEPCAAPLAMRIFGGLPGVRVAHVTGAIRCVDALLPRVTFVSQRLYANVHQVYPMPDRHPVKLVAFDEATESITVHPREGGMPTVGRLDLAAPPGAWCLTARIGLEHELAKPTRFALLAAALVQKGADSALLDPIDEKSVWFSGWVELAALERGRISVFIPKPGGGALSVYLLTQQAPDASSDFAWARFARLEFAGAPRAADAGAV